VVAPASGLAVQERSVPWIASLSALWDFCGELVASESRACQGQGSEKTRATVFELKRLIAWLALAGGVLADTRSGHMAVPVEESAGFDDKDGSVNISQ
jgi:hypothetical protein